MIDHDIVSAWLSLYSVEMAGVVASSDLPGVSCLGWLATMQLRATLSNSFCKSNFVKILWAQELYFSGRELYFSGHSNCISGVGPTYLNLWCAVDELVSPELEGGILDELDEGDEESPGVGPVHDQPLQQHPNGGDEDEHGIEENNQEENVEDGRVCSANDGGDIDDGEDDATATADDDVAKPGDLLLNGLGVGLGEEVEEAAGVVVGVRVGVAQLVRDTVEEEVATLGVHVNGKVLQGEIIGLMSACPNALPGKYPYGCCGRCCSCWGCGPWPG